jgi:DNA-binding SARP family transcriptional activator/tetratricopeptide (TPR) repeat protein
MPVEFRLLGAVEVRIGGRVLDVGHARQRCVLVALLVEANRPVPVDELVDRVWARQLPQHPRGALYGYLARLRQVLAATNDVRIARQPGGYVFTVDPMAVDLHRFRRLIAQARAADGDQDAAALFEEALGLWRGEAFATLDTPWLNTVRTALDRQRLTAELDRNDLALGRGQHAALLGDLSAGAAADPLNERLAGHLMLATYRCGGQADALEHYEQIRRRLAEELGVDPSPPLQQLYRRILDADPALTVPTVTAATSIRNSPAAPVPRQLPAPARHFAGRVAELEVLAGLLEEAADMGGTVVVSAIDGTAGIGKTALAVHWAHRVADRFPDGQLYVNLRGFDSGGQAMAPAEAVRGFLDAFAVSPERIPADLEAQAALYRSLLAGKRVLVVLDNARDTGQVRPLLPGTPGCLVLVTSRNQLSGLVAAEGAHPLTLDLLSEAEAHQLLARRLSPDGVAAEPHAVEEIITRCARLPLALTIVAARAAAHPHFPLQALAGELRDSRDRLNALADGDSAADMRAVFSWSYQALTPEAARLFRLLGLHPGPDISAAAAASLAGVPLLQVRPLLAELARAHLIVEHTPGRYTFHDLLRAYATEQAHTTDTDDERHAASRRMLDHYLHTAYTADRLLNPHRDPITPPPSHPGVIPETPTGHGQDLEWFTTEHPVLLTAIHHAAHTGFDTHTWHLAWALSTFLDRRGHWYDWAITQQIALAAALRLGDLEGQAHAHRELATAYRGLGRLDDAHAHLRHALDLNGQVDSCAGQARTRYILSLVFERRGRYREALDHANQALDLYRAADHGPGQANALNSVGWSHAQLGDHLQALAACQQALTLHQGLGNPAGEAATWDSLGYAHHHLGHHPQAITCFQHALHLVRSLGERCNEAEVLTHLGDTHHAAGHPGAARDAWRHAQDILDELDHPNADEVRAKLHHLDQPATATHPPSSGSTSPDTAPPA